MADPLLSIWPTDNTRRVVKAEAQIVNVDQRVYRIAFMDSVGKQLAVQIPLAAVRTISETAEAILDQVS
jgi:endo-1,4-beta-mannosidase